MSDQEISHLLTLLDEGDNKAKLRALRRLAALGDPRAIRQVAMLYENPAAAPAVRREAQKTLGVYQAIQDALTHNTDVELPDPANVKEPRFTPEFLRRALVFLAVLFVALVLANVLILLTSAPSTGEQQADLLARLENLYGQLALIAENQRQAWEAAAGTGPPDCAVSNPPLPLEPDLNIDAEAFPTLRQINVLLLDSHTQLNLATNNFFLACSSGSGFMQSLDAVTQAQISLNQARSLLDGVHIEMAATTEAPPTEPPSATEAPTEITAPVTGPTATPAIDPNVYRNYLLNIRRRLDDLNGQRGLVTQLAQFWQDVATGGQTGGCGVVLDPAQLQEESIPADVLAAAPRLQNLLTRFNLGLNFTNYSLTLFRQGCTNNALAAQLTSGQEQIQNAQNVFDQASQLVDQLLGELLTP